MIEFITKDPEIMFSASGEMRVILTAPRTEAKSFEGLPKGKDLAVTIKRHHKKRSLDANALLWVMCDNIAKKISASKEEVYKRFIRDYGVFEIVPIRNEAAESFRLKWERHGLGWFCEYVGASKITGYTRVIAYFGSSAYDSAEMSRVLEQVLEEARGLGISTISQKEMQSLCAAYGVE